MKKCPSQPIKLKNKNISLADIDEEMLEILVHVYLLGYKEGRRIEVKKEKYPE